jgi:trehalose/maltose hydrolase-like predicted phosphorylase/hydroxymethylpyrimidine pyrophosphatase-like HAD family hydrolase
MVHSATYDLSTAALHKEKETLSLLSWPAKILSPFQALIFDWDGTAVADRSSDTWPLIAALEECLRHGIVSVIVTGTHFENVNNQTIRYLSPLAKSNLFVCTNRGSEVFAFDEFGGEHLLFLRQSTPDEEVALDRAARALKDDLEQFGLKTQVVGNRLNRRKIDLIPIDSWRDPKKSQFKELLGAVQSRLKQTQLLGGLPALLNIARKLSQNAGLGSPKITSDIKHIEVGLTDKSDSIHWIFENVLQGRGLMPNQVVILGDEFGKIGGLHGSDALMRVASLQDATYISVGIEPEGVPEGVVHIGGGPQAFVEFLKAQNEIRQADTRIYIPKIISLGWKEKDSTWLLEQEGFDPSRESELEPLFTVGNGYLGIRGGVSIPIPSSRGDLHLAGVYDRKIGMLPYSELDFMTVNRKDHVFTEIVTFPSVFQFTCRVNGKEYVPGRWPGETYRRDLSLGTGILYEQFKLPLEGKERTLQIQTSRFASLQCPHLLVQEIEVFTQEEDVEIDLDTSFEGFERELRYPHLTLLSKETGNQFFTELYEFNTQASQLRTVFVARMWCDRKEVRDPRITFKLEPFRSVIIHRLILVSVSRDQMGTKEQTLDVIRTLRIDQIPFYLYEHVHPWRSFWSIADIQFKSNPELTEAQRFNLYHLRIASGTDPRISIGARSLTGNAYEGHTFWDAEIFVLPFLVHTDPKLAKNCLRYRYTTLETARRRAQKMGYQGACFAWESTVSGEDVTPTQIILKGYNRQIPIYTGEQQLHITADIAFAVWKYWSCTQDRSWLIDQGLEIMIETARFWASKVTLERDLYHILKVVGPDEYHHDVDDNTYTNWMVRLNLKHAYDFCNEVRESDKKVWNELVARIALKGDELKHWNDIVRRIYLPEPNQNGVIEQFRGFFDLKERKADRAEKLKAPLDRLLAWNQVNHEQMIKQADVLMIPFLCPGSFSNEVLVANYQYYEPRTDHGSSLSPPVYAAIAAQIGEWEDCERYWNIALHLDLLNIMKNASLGVHVGCMGGAWQALMFHIVGIKETEDRIEVQEKTGKPISALWQNLEAKILFREKCFQVQIGERSKAALWLNKKEK